MSLSTCLRDIPEHLLSERIREAAKWRRGSESNTPRLAKQTDSGFEDREGHQAPITLRGKNGKKEALNLANTADFIDDCVRLGELASRDLRINLLSIYSYFKHAAAGRY